MVVPKSWPIATSVDDSLASFKWIETFLTKTVEIN